MVQSRDKHQAFGRKKLSGLDESGHLLLFLLLILQAVLKLGGGGSGKILLWTDNPLRLVQQLRGST